MTAEMDGKVTLDEFAKRIDDRVRSDAVSRMLMEQKAFMDGFDRNWPGIYIPKSFVSEVRSRLHNAWLALKGHDIASDDY